MVGKVNVGKAEKKTENAVKECKNECDDEEKRKLVE